MLAYMEKIFILGQYIAPVAAPPQESRPVEAEFGTRLSTPGMSLPSLACLPEAGGR